MNCTQGNTRRRGKSAFSVSVLAAALALGTASASGGQLPGVAPSQVDGQLDDLIVVPAAAEPVAQPLALRIEPLLERYQALAANGGWPALETRRTLKAGDRSSDVAVLRERLEISGDLVQPPIDVELFDDDLSAAVHAFQARHGLEVDGVVGPRTRAELNVPAHARVAQIERNLARWNELPADLGERYVMVNIPAFELEVVDQHEVVMEMPVVVGKRQRPTPIFSDQITHLVLNPSWGVPARIARVDILRKVKRNPNYLAAGKFSVYEGHGANARRISASSVNWDEVSASDFPYSFRQAPGPKNALGRIKFMFPNGYNVYLHDTSSPALFARDVRAFSSGCVRVSQPEALAELLLRDDPQWSNSEIQRVLDSKRSRRVDLVNPVPVHLAYVTAWQAKDGSAQFRPDIYKRDRVRVSSR